MEQYIKYNESYVKEGTPVFSCNSRIVRYGDGLYENIHASGRELQFFKEHIESLVRGMNFLKMEIPAKIFPNSDILYNEITSLLHRNRLYQGVFVRLTVYRESIQNRPLISYLIETTKLDKSEYSLNDKGIILGLNEDYKKPRQSFLNYKTLNAIPYVFAHQYASEREFGDCLLQNEDGEISESLYSNLFLVRERTIYTPPLTSGCTEGVMREKIIKIARELGYPVFDDSPVLEIDVLTSDEILLTNAIDGINWVMAYKDRRFYNKTGHLLSKRLNQIAFQKKI